MSWLTAPFYDWALSATEAACFSDWRAALLADLRGNVLEIGAGTGLNVPHYPATVSRLVITEPDRHMRRQIADRPCAVAEVEIRGDSAMALDAPDQSFDTVVGTLMLCTVPDVEATLAEVRRVLVPGGRFVFLEHVAAEDNPRRLRWQRRIEPVWKVFAEGCHLTRTTARSIEAAGFRFESLHRESARKAMPIVRPTIRGVAIVQPAG